MYIYLFCNPYGACPVCEGYGNIISIDAELVIPNTTLSVFENAIFPWRGESMSWFRDELVNNAYKFDFPIHKPFINLQRIKKRANMDW
jgi:excinuclease ABC subunit A